MLIFWIICFCISLFILIKGSDILLNSAEKIGIAFGLSSFLIGALIIGFGTSLPEIITSLVAVFYNQEEIVLSSAIGSNISNILLVLGISVLISKEILFSKKNLSLDIPVLFIITIIFSFLALDSQINLIESLLLLIMFAFYFYWTIKNNKTQTHRQDNKQKNIGSFIVHAAAERQKEARFKEAEFKDIFLILLGVIFLSLGAKYLVESISKIAELLYISTELIAIFAVALGTSLPELMVSIKSALERKTDLILGNILGSNVFNLLFVVGLPGLFITLPLDSKTLGLGLFFLFFSTFFIFISSQSGRLYFYHGVLFVIFYLTFVAKLFNII